MTNVLILTQPDDVHAITVKFALEQKGHQAMMCYSGDFPEQEAHHIKYVDGILDWSYQKHGIDVVWNRRLGRPILPSYLHHDDIENAKKEVDAFYASLWQTVMPSAIWINPVDRQKKANIKSYQLKVASEVGLTIPETIITNHPEKIKDFISQHHTIYKSLMPLTWFDDEQTAMVYTRTIEMGALPSDRILQSVPGIFQEKIEKQHEVRVTYFGDEYIAVKIDSQQHSKGELDWRYIPTNELILEQISLPVEIDRQCQLMMWRLGLLFGCFDFIVTPSDEYYFLEINEQGQFLWIERVNETISILDTFTNFLIRKGNNNRLPRKVKEVRLYDLDDKVLPYMRQEVVKHKGSVLVRSHV